MVGGRRNLPAKGFVAVVLLYYDARVEKEAFDVTMLARSSVQP